jgi:hypothetical protein
MNKLTPEQLVSNLYNASRLAPIPMDQHEILRANAQELLDLISKSVSNKELETTPVEVLVKE